MRITLLCSLFCFFILFSGCASRTPPGAPGPSSFSQETVSSLPPEASSQESASDAGPAAPLVRTGNLPAELAASPAYRQAASYPDSVILVDDHVLTSGDLPRSFLEKVEKGEAAQLRYYEFTSPMPQWDIGWRVYTSVLVNPGDGSPPYQYHEELDGEDVLTASWVTQEDPVCWTINTLELKDSGVLVFQADIFEPTSLLVIDPEEIYPDYRRMEQIGETYLSPIYYDLQGGLTFSSLQDIPNWLFLFDDIYAYLDLDQNNGNLLAAYPDGQIPFSVVLDYLTRYFDLDGDTLRLRLLSSSRYPCYQPDTDTVIFEPGRGGVGPRLQVTDYQETDGSAVIRYRFCDHSTREPVPGENYAMTVRLLEDGTFRYQSIVKDDTPPV